MKKISFCSVKGGTGKSTLSILNSLTLTAQGEKVLFIDLDPQHSGTFFFTEEPTSKSIFNVFMGETIESQITQTVYGVDLIPSDLRLLDTRTIETNRLRKALSKIEDYDFIIIDTAPTYDGLTQNAYLTSDAIIIPSTVDAFSYKTIYFLLEKLEDLELDADIGIVLNLWKPPKETVKDTAWSKREAKLFLEDERLKDYILDNSIPKANPYRRIITEQGYKLREKALEPIVALVDEITGIQPKLDFIGAIA